MKLGVRAGESFTRRAIIEASAKGRTAQLAVAEKRYGRTHPEVVEHVRAAVAAGSLGGVDFGGPLSNFGPMGREYVQLVRQQSLIGRMTAARHVPLKSPIAVEAVAASAYWRSESGPKPLTKIQYSPLTTLEPRTASVVVVVSRELLEFSGCESEIQQSLVRSLVHHLDQSLLDPDLAASASNPASITNGATIITPTGTTALLVKADLRSAAVAVAAACEFKQPVWIMRPIVATKLAAMSDTTGAPAFPQINAVTGGLLIGIPVLLTSAAEGFDSPTSETITLVDSSELLIADDDQVRLDVTTEADVQMSDTPSGSASQMVSLWQSNLVGMRVERVLNWMLSRPNAAASLAVTF